MEDRQVIQSHLETLVYSRLRWRRAPADQYEQEADRSAGLSQAQAMNWQVPEEEKDKLQGKYRDDKIRRQMEEEKEKPI
jgi:hypothetical protein